MTTTNAHSQVRPTPPSFARVRAFYEELPFNYESSTIGQASMIREANQIETYSPLADFLRSSKALRVLDAGCGAGWFTNSAAHYYDCHATGVDFCTKALERARATAMELGTHTTTRFIEADLFHVEEALPAESFDVMNSLGVLHHTHDAEGAFNKLVPLVRPGGWINLGLYHRYGRWPLMEMFRPVRDALASATTSQEMIEIEEEGFRAWCALHDPSADPVFQRSWYRDQCLHPHETQWTLQEVLQWFLRNGIEPSRCSLDRFSSTPDWNELAANEHEQEDIAQEHLCANERFFPGFFVVWGRRL